MGGAILLIDKLRCDEPQDSLTDEVSIQHNGHHVWPGTGDAFFSMSKGNTAENINLQLPFGDSPTTEITLFDQEDIGSDDNLGGVIIDESEAGTGPQTFQIVGPGSAYTLFYRVGRIQF
jgi:hypothetical protein